MQRLTRRDFLRLGAGVSVAAGMSQIFMGCDGDEAAAPTPVPSPTAQPSAHVAAIRGDDLYSMSREALEALGGIERIVNAGETVFIKPNMVTLPFVPRLGDRFAAGDCTKPEILIAVAEESLRAGAAEVIIGDGSQMPTFDWELATTLDGSTNLAAEAARLSSKYRGKVTLACLDVDSPEWVEVPTSISIGKVAISSLVTQADRVISIPVVKTHEWAQLTLSLKNFIGITPLERYGWRNQPNYDRILLHIHDFTPQAIAQLYLDIADAVKPDLAIIDASIGVEGNGPVAAADRGLTVDMKDRLGSWLLLASTDLVAADATAARVVNHDVAYVDRILSKGFEIGLGEVREDSIEIIGDRLDDLRVEWLPAELATPGLGEGPRRGPSGTPAYVAARQTTHP